MIRLMLFLTLCISHATFARTELTLWHSQGPNEQFWHDTVRQFNQSQDKTKVTLVIIPRKELNSSITTSVMVDDAPDMVLIQSDVIGLKSYFKLSPVPNAWLDGYTDNLMNKFITSGSERYGIPVSFGNHLVLYYNKQYIQSPAKTWQEMVLQTKSLPKDVKILATNYRSSYFFITFWNAFGDQFVYPERVDLYSPSTVKALNFYRDGHQILQPNCNYACVSTDFFDGKYAYVINGDWEYERTKELLGDNLGVALLPSIEGKPLASMKSALTLSFPNYVLAGKKKNLIHMFVQHIKSKEFANGVFDHLHALPAHTSVRQEILSRLEGNDKIFNQQLALSKPMTPSPSLITAWDSISKGLKLFIDGQAQADEAAKFMQKSADHELHRVLEGI